jgi:hypothetical protein
MMLGFANNPPGAIPPPTISPATEKYDRPKEAHSSSNNSLQQVLDSVKMKIVVKYFSH